jgi:cysteine-rich repeat protein
MQYRYTSLTFALVLLGCFDPTQNNVGAEDGTSSTGDTPTGSGTTVGTTDSVGETDSGGETDAETTGDGSSEESGAPGCGDGVVEDGEVCDDGINDGSYGGCLGDCSDFGPYCGDGVVLRGAGEDCDDGDDVDGNGCNIDCTQSGAVLWTQTHSTDIEESLDYGTDIDVDEDGTILAVGGVALEGSGTPAASILLWYDAEGILLDEQTPPEPYSRVRFGGPGYVLLEPGAPVGGGVAEVAVSTFDEAGTEVWRRTVSADRAWDLAVDGGGGVYVAAENHAAFALLWQAIRVRIEPEGDIAWQDVETEQTSGCDDVAVLEGVGAVFMCGGFTQWVEPDETVVGELEQGMRILDVHSDGTYVASDYDDLFGFDEAGEGVWSAAGLSPVDIAIDSVGNVVAVEDGLTAKFGPDGGELWTDEHDADGVGVAIGPDDTIAVIGTRGPDLWVRKYAP